MTANGDVKRTNEEQCGSCQPDEILELRLLASDFSHSAGVSFDIGMSVINETFLFTLTDVPMQSLTACAKAKHRTLPNSCTAMNLSTACAMHEGKCLRDAKMYFVSVYSSSNITYVPFWFCLLRLLYISYRSKIKHRQLTLPYTSASLPPVHKLMFLAAQFL